MPGFVVPSLEAALAAVEELGAKIVQSPTQYIWEGIEKGQQS